MAYRHDGFWQCMDTLRDKQAARGAVGVGRGALEGLGLTDAGPRHRHDGYIGSTLVPHAAATRATRSSASTASCSRTAASAGVPASESLRSNATSATSTGRHSRASTPWSTSPASPTTRWATSTRSRTYDINHRGTVRLAEAAKEAGVQRFVFSSSCSLYGAGGDDILDEEADVQPGHARTASRRCSPSAISPSSPTTTSAPPTCATPPPTASRPPARRPRGQQPRRLRVHDRRGAA